jgi:hypothetical protein
MIEICPNIVNPKNLLAAYRHDIFIAVTKNTIPSWQLIPIAAASFLMIKTILLPDLPHSKCSLCFLT